MGWLFYDSRNYKANGEVDRKREMDSKFSEGYAVLKSSMVGTTYYAAVEHKRKGIVSGFVALTSSDKRGGYNFGYKDMDETCGPVESKCPLSILNLLTLTDSESANAWRERCREYHRQKASPHNFSKLPLGTKAIWTKPGTGEKIELTKEKVGKTNYWVDWDARIKYSGSRVNPKDLEFI